MPCKVRYTASVTTAAVSITMRIILAPMEGVIDHTMRDMRTGLGGQPQVLAENAVRGAALAARTDRGLAA